MHDKLQRLTKKIGSSVQRVNYTQSRTGAKRLNSYFRLMSVKFLAFAQLCLLCFSVLLPLPNRAGPAVQAQAMPTNPTLVDQTQNIKAMGYTDSRKIVRDSSGHLYVAYRKKYKLHHETAYHIFVAKSTDNGSHWTVLNDEQPIEAVGDFNQRVAAIAIDRQDVLHVVWYGPDAATGPTEENQIKYVRSMDGGKSWSAWRNISPVPGYSNQDLWQEHPTIFVDQRDHLYIVWEGRDQRYAKTAQVKFIKSTNHGLAWSAWLNIAPSSDSHSRPSLVTSADKLYVFAYGSRNGIQQILYSFSADGGARWARWRQVAASTQDQRHVSAAVDTAGHIHLVWRQLPFAVTQPQDHRAQIYYTSFDGTSWRVPVRAAPHIGIAQTYPSIAIDQEETVWITWLETDGAYGFPQDAPTTGSVYYTAKTNAGWSSPILYAAGANNLYPSLRRDLTASTAQIDVVWLEALPNANLIRFAQLTRPTTFQPARLPNEVIQTSSFLPNAVAQLWQVDSPPLQPVLATVFAQPDQLWRDLRAILTLVVVVSLYVTVKFLINRWLTVVFR